MGCLLLDRLGFSVTCTLVTLELLTGIQIQATDCIRGMDVDNSCRHASMTVSIVTLLTLHVRNYTLLLIAIRLPSHIIRDLKL